MSQMQRAVLYMTTAAAVFGLVTLLAKALGQSTGTAQGLPPFMVSAGRFVFAFLALLVFVALRPQTRPTFKGARFDRHLGRSICGWLGVTAIFAAAARMPLGEATAISFLNPLIAMALAIPLLGESATLRKGIAAALAVIGAMLLLQPGTAAFRPAAVFALIGAFFTGIEVIFIKLLSDTEPPLRILIINNAIGAVVSASVALFVWVPPAQYQWLLLMALGLLMVLAQACFIQAMKRGAATAILPVFYLTLVFAAAYDYALYGVRPDRIAGIGAALVVCGAWITTLAPQSTEKLRT